LKRAEVISSEEAIRVRTLYEENGWLKEMEEQIAGSGAIAKGFTDWKGLDLLNVRFRPVDLRVNEPYYELPRSHPVYGQTRYAFVHYTEAFDVVREEADGFKFESTMGVEGSGDAGVMVSEYYRQPQAVEILHLHRAISEKLYARFCGTHGVENVRREQPAGYGGNRIDMVVRKRDGKFAFYEIKAYNSPTTSIRQALGQLLEYACWPNKRRAEELVIVTPKHAETEGVRIYMEHLRREFSIPIYCQAYDHETDSLGERV
jgi:hypothetical protein